MAGKNQPGCKCCATTTPPSPTIYIVPAWCLPFSDADALSYAQGNNAVAPTPSAGERYGVAQGASGTLIYLDANYNTITVGPVTADSRGVLTFAGLIPGQVYQCALTMPGEPQESPAGGSVTAPSKATSTPVAKSFAFSLDGDYTCVGNTNRYPGPNRLMTPRTLYLTNDFGTIALIYTNKNTSTGPAAWYACQSVTLPFGLLASATTQTACNTGSVSATIYWRFEIYPGSSGPPAGTTGTDSIFSLVPRLFYNGLDSQYPGRVQARGRAVPDPGSTMVADELGRNTICQPANPGQQTTYSCLRSFGNDSIKAGYGDLGPANSLPSSTIRPFVIRFPAIQQGIDASGNPVMLTGASMVSS